jgi:DNA invertase Pin-like site-specific DNA recombinase
MKTTKPAKPGNTSPTCNIAYSYVRFSTPEQMKGDSLRRQTTGAEEYCARHGLTLDTALSLHDLGVSGFKGKHRSDKHALGQFLKLAKEGRIPAGATLIVENLDRLSREEERPALRLWMDILDQKINIVQLTPETVFRHEKSDMFDIMRAIMELSRGHGESARKTERLGAAWDAKRAGIGQRKLTGKCPFWLTLSADRSRFSLFPARVEIVKRMFRLAQSGHGSGRIARILNAEGILSPYRRPWNNVSVLSILRSRSVLGEYTPCTVRDGKRRPIGEVIADYYPPIIDEPTYLAVQAAITSRKHQRGRLGKRVRNLFTELIRDARDGATMNVVTKREDDPRLVSASAIRGVRGSEYVSISYSVFEKAVLSQLAEIDPREILGWEDKPDRSMVLAGEKEKVEEKIAELETALLEGDSAAVAKVIRHQEERKRQIEAELQEARQQEAHPLSQVWSTAQSLLTTLANSKDQEDARLRLRSAIHRIIDAIWLLVIPRKRDRVIAAQLWFADGERCRNYIILHRPPKVKGPLKLVGKWWVRSLASVVNLRDIDLDLRKHDHAKKLESALSSCDLTESR